jgi:hypothetical protein
VIGIGARPRVYKKHYVNYDVRGRWALNFLLSTDWGAMDFTSLSRKLKTRMSVVWVERLSSWAHKRYVQ